MQPVWAPISFTAVVTDVKYFDADCSVNFMDGSTVLASRRSRSGVASYVNSTLAAGTHTLPPHIRVMQT